MARRHLARLLGSRTRDPIARAEKFARRRPEDFFCRTRKRGKKRTRTVASCLQGDDAHKGATCCLILRGIFYNAKLIAIADAMAYNDCSLDEWPASPLPP